MPSPSSPTTPDAQAVQRLLPGREVRVLDGAAVARVYPLGICHLRKFSGQIAAAMQLLGSVPMPRPPAEAEYEGRPADLQRAQEAWARARGDYGTSVMRRVVPFLLEHAFDLLQDCVVIEPAGMKFEELAHWDFPVVAEAWVEESFGEERKWRPWVEVLEKAVTRATGQPFSILETISSSSSAPGTP